MADLTATVDTDGTGDYLTLQAAETAEGQDLTDGGGDTWTCTCEASSGTADTTATSFNGFTVADGNTVTLIAKAGEEAQKDGIDTARYRLSPAAGIALRLFDGWTNLTDLQIESTSDGIVMESGAVGTVNIERCYLNKSSGSGDIGISHGSEATLTVNLIASAIAGTFFDGVQCNTGAFNASNCVIWGATSDGIEWNTGTTGSVINCIVNGGSDDFDIDGGATVTGTNNMSGDGDLSNAVAISGGDIDNELVDAANGDFTIVITGNAYQGGSNTTLATTDMDGDTFDASTPSLGVDESVAAGGSPVASILQQHAA